MGVKEPVTLALSGLKGRSWNVHLVCASLLGCRPWEIEVSLDSSVPHCSKQPLEGAVSPQFPVNFPPLALPVPLCQERIWETWGGYLGGLQTQLGARRPCGASRT